MLFFFGWQIARYLLKENRIEHLIGLSGIFGIGLYLFLINILGYFIPIKITFYLVLLLIFIIGIILFYFNKSKALEWGTDKKWRKILFGFTILLVISNGLIFFRMPLKGDILQAGSMPTAATMAEGNFPPTEIWEPGHPLVYHYAFELLTASIYKITGLPLYLAYNFLIAILIGILFLLGFILVKNFCNDNFKAFVSSLIMLYGGSLVFLKGINGVSILYNKYILQQDIYAPFKFVLQSIESVFSIPVLENMLKTSWSVLAFPLMVVIVYLYLYSIKHEYSKKIALFNSILLALLALSAETYFAIFCFVLFIYPFAYGFIKKDWFTAKRFLIISFLIVLIALPIAFFQGGVLKTLLMPNPNPSATEYYFTSQINKVFKINKTPWLLNTDYGEYGVNWLAIYDSKFLLELGLLLFLFIPAVVFILKRYFQPGLMLGMLSITFFLIPFFINFVHPGDMRRIFYPFNLFGGLIVGLFLMALYLLVKKRWLKKIIIFIVIVLIAQTVLFQLLFLSIGYPPGTWNGSDKIFGRAKSFEGRVYNWVRENTTLDDYFLILKKEDDDLEAAPNHRFVLNTGRMAPIYAYHWDNYQTGNLPSFLEPDLFRKIRKECDAYGIKNLNYDYLYVNERWPSDLEEKCLANNNLELIFQAKEGDEFVRIYKIIY